MPKPGDLVAGKYVVDQLLGEGGMGAVFAATHRLTGKQVALKWMLPELARDEDAVHRFMREAQAAGRINHPNVVDVYDVGQHDESFFLVMELLRGEPLTSALSRRDLTVREVLDILLRAMRGVASAHRQGVVHRDLKPDNIFLAYEEDGVRREPKVLDFGISKVSNEGQINPRLTRTGAVVGTPYYMSPEQIRGSDTLDRRADVYAFGVILYEALTGQVPFIADTYGALVLEIATATPKTPSELVPGLPPELSLVVMQAMARNAQDRFPDLESLIHALEPFVNENYQPRSSSVSAKPRILTHNASAVSTPFAAETPASTPFGRVNGRSFAFVLGAGALVGLVWFVIQQARTPEVPVVAPAVQPAPIDAITPPPSAATDKPRDAAPLAPLPHGMSTPGSNEPATARNTGTPNPPPQSVHKAGTGSDGRRSRPQPKEPARNERERERPAPVQVTAPPPSPEPVQVKPVPASPPNRRARSGPLSVDEF